MLRYEQRQVDARRRAFVITFPGDNSFAQVADWLNSIAPALGAASGAWLAVDSLVLERITEERGTYYRLLCASDDADLILNQLRSHFPGVHVEYQRYPESPKWTHVREYGKTDGLLKTDKPEAANRSLMGAYRNPRPREAAMYQLVISRMHADMATQSKGWGWLKVLVKGWHTPIIYKEPVKTERPVFIGTLRTAVRAEDKPRARQVLKAMEQAIRSLQEGQATFQRHWRWPWVLERVRQASTPLFFTANLTLSEAAVLSCIPLKDHQVPGVARVRMHHLPAEWSIPGAGEGNILLGRSTLDERRLVGIKQADLMTHLLLLGKTGTGKSSVLENQIAQIISQRWLDSRGEEKKQGFMLLDPHGDITWNGLNLITRDRIGDVIYVDPLNTTRPVGMNLMTGPNPGLITNYIMGVIQALHGTGPMTSHVLRNAVYTVALHGGMTIYEVMLMLEDSDFRQEVTRAVKGQEPRIDQFWDDFQRSTRAEKLQQVQPISRRLGALLMPEFKGIFGQTGGLDMQQVLADGKIVYVNLSQGKIGEDNADLLGALTIALFWQAVRGRANVPEGDRVPYYLLADEFHRYMKLPTAFGDILAEARKFRLGLSMATQSIGQIAEVRNDVLVNARNKLVFETGASDANMIARELGVDADVITHLPEHTAVLSIPHAPPATIKTFEPPKPVGLARDVVEASNRNYGKPMADVEAEIQSRRVPRPKHKRYRPQPGL